eukprot:653826-Rhodomonas_salina.3
MLLPALDEKNPPPPPVEPGTRISAISLRAPYAMCGTDLAYAAICLRAPYAMSATELVYAAIFLPCPCPILTVFGTEDSAYHATSLCYQPTRFLRDVRHLPGTNTGVPGRMGVPDTNTGGTWAHRNGRRARYLAEPAASRAELPPAPHRTAALRHAAPV